ncbi:nucleoside diphosphate kinase 7 [Orussus abietinus]|uniref:nucleoside diphosphate kinase 7 n=1 Tax=Orussus abietinus TaxID=222816 RepID=UPI00062662F5|nr:nucleoside diphosphate kinase 7 [Orussus abietinus]
MNVAERYSFEAEWYDKMSCILKTFYLYFYPIDNSVELFDRKARKVFLRRSKCDGLEAKDFFVGGMVNIFSRNLKILDYADESTKKKLASSMQRTCAMLKPDVMDKMGEILKKITYHNFHIGNIKMVHLTREQARELYKDRANYKASDIQNFMASGLVLVLELLGENAISKWVELLGPEDPLEAREKSPASFRACYGTDFIRNAFHGSANSEAAEKELNFFFPDPKKGQQGPQDTVTLQKCTCCVIKPHAVQAGHIGDIIEDIQKAGFKISALQQFYVDPTNAEEFLEVYKGVLPDYGAMVAELQSGPCIAMEITHKDQSVDVPIEFRQLCGPMDAEIAKQLRPQSLRAKYGKSKVQNAVHCSDLPEDGLLEVEYFFKILALYG